MDILQPGGLPSWLHRGDAAWYLLQRAGDPPIAHRGAEEEELQGQVGHFSVTFICL